jgi:hypothetical protein
LSPFPVDFLKFLLNLGKHPLADQKDFPTWNFQRWGANISLHSFTNVLLKRPTRLQEKKKKNHKGIFVLATKLSFSPD